MEWIARQFKNRKNWFCNRFSQKQNIPVKFETTHFKNRLVPDYETVLYRITQEELTNIRKHAQAKKVKIHLEHSEEIITLTIEDDGIAFNMVNVWLFSNRQVQRELLPCMPSQKVWKDPGYLLR